MKSREGVIRLKHFHLEAKRRQVAQIEAMVAEFERMAKELDNQILAEQERSGIHDAGHFAYPTFAKAAIQRRDNLASSVSELNEQLVTAKAECDAAAEDLKKQEAIAQRDHANDKHAAPKSAADPPEAAAATR